MKILLYEPLPDINRAPFIRALYLSLEKLGYQCLILTERNLIYTLNDSLTPKGVLRNNLHIANFFHGLNVSILPHNPRLYKNVSQKNIAQKREQLRAMREHWFQMNFQKFKPERCFIWNGNHDHQRDYICHLKRVKLQNKLFFAELGWLPQRENFYLDALGVNGSSAIAKQRFTQLNETQKKRLKKWQDKYIKQNIPAGDMKKNNVLVPLQIDTDTNITHYSKFGSMTEFLTLLGQWIPVDLKVIVRPHPLSTIEHQLNELPANFSVDNETPLFELIAKSEFVIGINSTSLIESLACQRKVFAFGSGVFDSCKEIGRINPDKLVPFKSISFNYTQCSPFLYYLVFEKQISFKKLKKSVIEQRYIPFPLPNVNKKEKIEVFKANLMERIAGKIYSVLFKLKYFKLVFW